MKNRKIFAAFSSVSVVSGLLFAFSMNNSDDTLCKVHVGYPHLSTFFQKLNNSQVVKINAYSTCTKPHSDITLRVELWKEGVLLKRFVKGSVSNYPGVLRPNIKFYNKETFELCKSNRETKYFGKAFGKALIEGEWYTATHVVRISTPVKCGT
jgi:hypothetical protein